MLGNNKNCILWTVCFMAVFILSGCNSDYQETNSNYSDYETPTFKGYECTDDCSGHEAGYNWAKKKGIIEPSDCSGKSNSFIEGCRSYAKEQ